MRYKCLVFDHDDTVVSSTAEIHHPSFQAFLDIKRPGMICTLENYFIKNFDPGFLEMCREDYGLTEEELQEELVFWMDYVKKIVPDAFPGIREIMNGHVSEGGIICVVSHSFDRNIRRDYEKNGLPEPAAVYGWERPVEERKPNPFPLQDIMRKFDLRPEEILMIDDLKPGYEMAKACGVDFAAVGFANDIPQIEAFMRENCKYYFKTVAQLAEFLNS